MAKKSYDKYKLPPYPVIVAAVGGDSEALQAIFRHYSSYIATLSMRSLYDENGEQHYVVDENIRSEMETHLARAIVGKFKAVPDE